MKWPRLGEMVAVVGICAILAAILFPVFAQSKGSKRSPCLSNVKQTALGLLNYAADADDRLPSRDAWVDATYPYTKNWSVYHCLQATGTKRGYAFDGALSRAQTTSEPSELPMVYDSVNPMKNASDLVTSLPRPGRHGVTKEGDKGRNTIGYLDGHARSVQAP